MDLLVRLYALPPLAPRLEAVAPAGVSVRRALASERHAVVAFAEAHGSRGWASECEVAFARRPLGCFVAVEAAPAAAQRGVVAPGGGYPSAPETLVGFACIEATAPGFFGPQAVREDRRGQGIGAALLLSALHALAAEGHAYAIVGWASELEFYRKVAGAVPIAGSEPGLYRAPLRT
ncbi:MAG TPA: GNAT family N-acetyltransferase [Polyangia bacterium]|nr:GNAT family N-acetyltransferase [Polyangia bacterium]